MEKLKRLIFVVTLLVLLIISGCGTKVTETPVTINSGANMALSSWITKPIQSTQSNLTIEVLHATLRDNDLVLRVKFPLPDWRSWYISKVRLTLGGEQVYVNAQTDFFERLYQKGINTYCLYQPSLNEIETCLQMESMETYQIDEIIFRDFPQDIKSKQVVLDILEVSSKVTNCTDLRLSYMEEVLSTDFPGLALECVPGAGKDGLKISESSNFADDVAAQAAVDALVEEANSGVITGPWTFEVSK